MTFGYWLLALMAASLVVFWATGANAGAAAEGDAHGDHGSHGGGHQ